MKKLIILSTIGLFALSCCMCIEDDVSPGASTPQRTKGYITFATNFETINCPVTSSIYIDGDYVNDITCSHDSIQDCGLSEYITRELEGGYHSYRITMTMLDENDETQVAEIERRELIKAGHCMKVLIDCSEYF